MLSKLGSSAPTSRSRADSGVKLKSGEPRLRRDARRSARKKRQELAEASTVAAPMDAARNLGERPLGRL